MSVYWPAWEMKLKKMEERRLCERLRRGRNVQQREVWRLGVAGGEGKIAKINK